MRQWRNKIIHHLIYWFPIRLSCLQSATKIVSMIVHYQNNETHSIWLKAKAMSTTISVRCGWSFFCNSISWTLNDYVNRANLKTLMYHPFNGYNYLLSGFSVQFFVIWCIKINSCHFVWQYNSFVSCSTLSACTKSKRFVAGDGNG